MPDIQRAPSRSPKPLLTLLHSAVKFAAEQGIPVAPDAYGVVATSTHIPAWERDPRAGSVCPLGAAVLERQPPVTDVLKAISIALGVSPATVAGIETGMLHTEPEAFWIRSPQRELYLGGLTAGTAIRAELIGKTCLLHGRFPVTSIICPTCSDGEEQG